MSLLAKLKLESSGGSFVQFDGESETAATKMPLLALLFWRLFAFSKSTNFKKFLHARSHGSQEILTGTNRQNVIIVTVDEIMVVETLITDSPFPCISKLLRNSLEF